MLQDSPLRQHRMVKVIPHCIDTVLLVSAIILAVSWHLNPLHHPWLLLKIVALFAYIGCGFVAFRFGKNRQIRAFFWILALLILAGIFVLAFTKPYF